MRRRNARSDRMPSEVEREIPASMKGGGARVDGAGGGGSRPTAHVPRVRFARPTVDAKIVFVPRESSGTDRGGALRNRDTTRAPGAGPQRFPCFALGAELWPGFRRGDGG